MRDVLGAGRVEFGLLGLGIQFLPFSVIDNAQGSSGGVDNDKVRFCSETLVTAAATEPRQLATENCQQKKKGDFK